MEPHQILVIHFPIRFLQRFAVLFQIDGEYYSSVSTIYSRLSYCNRHSTEKILFWVAADALNDVPLNPVANVVTVQEAFQIFNCAGEIFILLRKLKVSNPLILRKVDTNILAQNIMTDQFLLPLVTVARLVVLHEKIPVFLKCSSQPQNSFGMKLRNP
ncbi:hypothetical protein D3C73_623250 [compost metagenome]